MSLDKFLSDNKAKKKKKPIKKSKPEKKTEQIEKGSSEKLTDEDNSNHTNLEKNLNDTDSNVVTTNLEIDKRDETDLGTISTEGGKIFVPELQNKSRDELFEIILDIIHSSPSYSRNKNQITQYYLENKQDMDLDYIITQMDISIQELFVLLAEIKQDFD